MPAFRFPWLRSSLWLRLSMFCCVLLASGSQIARAQGITYSLSDQAARAEAEAPDGDSSATPVRAASFTELTAPRRFQELPEVSEPTCDICPDDADPWCEPVRLLPARPSGLQLFGWVDQGFTTNPDNPANPSHRVGNLPTSFNYRNDEYMLNQLYAVLEKPTDSCGCDWDVGGRVDLLYGQDYIFTQSAGLETRDDFTNRWNTRVGGNGIGGTGMMGLALPQAYVEVAHRDLKLKLGHFYTLIGYESVMAPSNFFYSHALTMQYGEPFTHTGGLVTWTGDRLTVNAGIVNGWDKFDAETDRASFLGNIVYTPCHERYTLTASLITGDEDGSVGGPLDNRTMYSFVFDWQVNDRWQYVLQHDLGIEQGVSADSEWYGVNQYLFYTINDCWKAGLRAEWFNDDDGQRVFPGIPGHYYQTTFGLNWSPHPNIVVRPEVRYAWYEEHSDGLVPDDIRPYSGNGPAGAFADPTVFNLDHQFTAAIDLLLLW